MASLPHLVFSSLSLTLRLAHIPLFLYPFLNTTSKTRPFEYLRLTSLGVIGALVKHIRTIENAIDCPGLYDEDEDDLPYGAIGLAGAAVCSLLASERCLSNL